MKKIFFCLILVTAMFTSWSQSCIDFAQPNLSRWFRVGIQPITIQNDVAHGNYIQLQDDNGMSWAVNEGDFGGNWIDKAPGGCLCFDYNVDWSAGNTATIPVKGPKFQIYYRTSTATYNTSNNSYLINTLSGSHASFVGWSTNPDLVNNQWKNFCLPISLADGINLPSNSFGTWIIFSGSTQLTGAAAATAWNTLIQNVKGVAFPTDYNSFPGEFIRFDNFCWSCASLPCTIALAVTQNNEVCSDHHGNISVVASGGMPPYSYSWNTGATTPALTNIEAGSYTVTVTDKNNCIKTQTIVLENKPCSDNPCCHNQFPFWTEIPIPPSYPFSEGTYGVEHFLVKGANTVPVTEIKITVEDFTLISKYGACLKCINKPATLGSIIGISTIGTGANQLTVQTQPYGAGNVLNQNVNEIIWKNPAGVTLNAADKISLVYILPQGSDIPCCVDYARVCIRISYRDVNCGYCEVFNCSTMSLLPKGTTSPLPTLAQLFQNARGNFQPFKAAGF
jgi:hypothetical protein